MAILEGLREEKMRIIGAVRDFWEVFPFLMEAIKRAVNRTIKEYKEGILKGEDIITTTLATRIRDVKMPTKGPIKIKVFTTSLERHKEHEIGADLFGCFEVFLPGWIKTRKIFLVQAKLFKNSPLPSQITTPIGFCIPWASSRNIVELWELWQEIYWYIIKRRWPYPFPVAIAFGPQIFVAKVQDSRLSQQCEKMLRLTPASFVWGYGKTAFGWTSAFWFQGGQSSWQGEWLDLPWFFASLALCAIGDETLGERIQTLAEMEEYAREQNAEQLLVVRVTRDE